MSKSIRKTTKFLSLKYIHKYTYIYLMMMMKLVKLKMMNQEMVQTEGPMQVNHWSLSFHSVLKIRILIKEYFISIKSTHLLFHRIIIAQYI